MAKQLAWYDLRQHALMSKAEQMRSEDAHWRWYMRMLAAARRPDRPAQVFNGWTPAECEHA